MERKQVIQDFIIGLEDSSPAFPIRHRVSLLVVSSRCLPVAPSFLNYMRVMKGLNVFTFAEGIVDARQLLISLSPDAGIAMGVENGNDLDRGFLLTVKDHMGKPAQQCSPHGGSHQSTRLGIAGDAVKHRIEGQAEIEGKSWMVGFVP